MCALHWLSPTSSRELFYLSQLGYPELSTHGKGFLQEPQNCVMLPKGHRGALFPPNKQCWCEEPFKSTARLGKYLGLWEGMLSPNIP